MDLESVAASCIDVSPYFSVNFAVWSKYSWILASDHSGEGIKFIALSMNTPGTQQKSGLRCSDNN